MQQKKMGKLVYFKILPNKQAYKFTRERTDWERTCASETKEPIQNMQSNPTHQETKDSVEKWGSLILHDDLVPH